MTAPQHPPPTAVAGPVTTQKLWQPVFMEELYLRAAKVLDAPEDLENVVGRDLDDSLVRRTNAHKSLPEASRRAARKEVVAIADLTSQKCISATTSLRWRISMQVAEEVSIFFASLALAIGIATAITDFAEMSQQAQEDKLVGSATEYPKTEKIHKPSSSSGQWRLLACIALLLAVVARIVALIGED